MTLTCFFLCTEFNEILFLLPDAVLIQRLCLFAFCFSLGASAQVKLPIEFRVPCAMLSVIFLQPLGQSFNKHSFSGFLNAEQETNLTHSKNIFLSIFHFTSPALKVSRIGGKWGLSYAQADISTSWAPSQSTLIQSQTFMASLIEQIRSTNRLEITRGWLRGRMLLMTLIVVQKTVFGYSFQNPNDSQLPSHKNPNPKCEALQL